MNSNSSDPYIIPVWSSFLRVGNGGAEGGGGTFKNLSVVFHISELTSGRKGYV